MKYSARKMLLATAVVAASWATNAGAATYTGSSTWQFSPGLTEVVAIPVGSSLDVNLIDVEGVGGGSVTKGYVYEWEFDFNRLDSVAVSTSVSGLQLASGSTVGVIHQTGGLNLAIHQMPGVSGGGDLTISDFAIDVLNKRVYATITGNFSGVPNQTLAPLANNTVSTIQNFYLFDFSTKDSVVAPSLGETATYTFSDLTLTTAGLYHLRSSLRLVSVGADIWNRLGDHGTLTTTITAVPEPSAYGLFLAGGLVLVMANWRGRNRT